MPTVLCSDYAAYGEQGCTVFDDIIKFITRLVMFNAPLWHTHVPKTNEDSRRGVKNSSGIAGLATTKRGDKHRKIESINAHNGSSTVTSDAHVCPLDIGVPAERNQEDTHDIRSKQSVNIASSSTPESDNDTTSPEHDV